MRRLWMCRCACGTERPVSQSHLVSGASTSCGCKKSGRPIIAINGGSKSSLYSRWKGMRARCNDPRSVHYAYYGGRGIAVCQQWDKSFTTFLADMGEPPFPGATIDRINNDGNYEPGNCRWATREEQCQNKRPRKAALANGIHTIPQIAKLAGVTEEAIRFRIASGWDLNDLYISRTDRG